MKASSSPDAKRRGRHIPLYFVAFFVVVAICDAIFVTIALRTHTGLETPHPYQRGLAYNEIIKSAEQQAHHGWQMALTYQIPDLRISLTDRHGKPLNDATLQAFFIRNSQPDNNFTSRLAYDASGTYHADVTVPLAGKWQIRVLAQKDNMDYQQFFDIFVPPVE